MKGNSLTKDNQIAHTDDQHLADFPQWAALLSWVLTQFDGIALSDFEDAGIEPLDVLLVLKAEAARHSKYPTLSLTRSIADLPHFHIRVSRHTASTPMEFWSPLAQPYADFIKDTTATYRIHVATTAHPAPDIIRAFLRNRFKPPRS